MKIRFVTLFLSVVVFAGGGSIFAQKSSDGVWTRINESSIRHTGVRHVNPAKFETFRLNETALLGVFAEAPMEFSAEARMGNTVLVIPDAKGNYVRFRIEESPILSPEVARDFPTWKTYQGYGIDDPTATARFDINANGFHGYVLSSNGTFFIDPYQSGDRANYQVYLKTNTQKRQFHCKLDEMFSSDKSFSDLLGNSSLAPQFSHGTQLRTYRLGIATTPQATAALGGQTTAFASVQTSTNRITGVYRKDLAVSFTLVTGTNMIFNTTTTIPPTAYSNNGSPDLGQNQSNMDAIIGSANYDIGHVFGSSDNGVASVSVVCVNGSKARGYSGQPNPSGDGHDIDYVAHEMGHQFSAQHTFNAQNDCNTVPAGNRKEPGAAVTIMGYAGICAGGSNPEAHSIDTFHVHSQTQIINFLAGTGGTCGTLTGSNSIPVIGALSNYNIPVNTPFALTASATDANSDPLTYNWEQDDSPNNLADYPATTDDDDTSFVFRPGFRSYLPTAGGTRTFPSLTYILNNANEAPVFFSNGSTNPVSGLICNPIATGNCISGEDLPSAARTMNFRVTVRDGQGGVADSLVQLSVSGANGAPGFSVTSPNTAVTYAGNSAQTVTWNVAGTDGAPVSAANVKISVSVDGGQTFPHVVAASTANDGSESVTIPNVNTTTARVKVEAVGNVFFDISNANFTINAVVAGRRAPFDYDGDDRTDVSIYRPTPGQWWYSRSSDSNVVAGAFGTSTDRITPGDFTGDGKTDIAFFRPSAGEWFILRSEDNSFFSFPFGSNGDVPTTGDYDNDGKADAAVFRPSTNTWFILKSGGGGVDIIGWGSAGDVPVAGDYDGDNKTDIAIFRPSNGQWWVRKSTDGSSLVIAFGVSTDRPVQGYYTADNKVDHAFWRPSTGEWFVLRSEDFSFTSAPFGSTGDIPAPGDYDGDDRFDLAIYRPSTTNWFVQRTTAGLLIQQFGISTDIPTPSAYVP